MKTDQITLDKAGIENLCAVVRYLWNDERRHYESDLSDNHIYLDVKALRAALDKAGIDPWEGYETRAERYVSIARSAQESAARQG